MGFDKRYKGEFCFHHPKTKQICIRLTEMEISMLDSLYPDNNRSYAIRSLIYDNYKNLEKKM